MSELQIKYIKPSSLIPYAKNSRIHSEAQVQQIASSIKEFGFCNPILISKDKDIVAGHGRLQAAHLLNLETVPVIELGHLTEAQKKAYVIVDNRLAENASWDTSMLSLEIEYLKNIDFDTKILGFDDDFLKKIFPTSEKESFSDEDDVPEISGETVTKPGDLWILGNHRLLCGDSTKKEDVERLMNGEKADMVFTDPPYGVSYEKKTKEIFKQTDRYRKIENDDICVDDLKKLIRSCFINIESVLADKSCYYICSPQGGELGLMMMMMMQESGIPCRHMCIWVKNAPVFSMGRLDYDYQHEPILFGWSKKRTHMKSTNNGTWKSSVWFCDREPNKLHPTMKPVALIENAILNSCPDDGLLFEPFCGSGSTIIGSEKTGRRCYGIEIDPHYCGVIIERWQQFTGKEAFLEDSKKTFNSFKTKD